MLFYLRFGICRAVSKSIGFNYRRRQAGHGVACPVKYIWNVGEEKDAREFHNIRSR